MFQAIILIVVLIIISLIVALALLDKELPDAIYYVVMVLSVFHLILSFRVEMDLALIDPNLL